MIVLLGAVITASLPEYLDQHVAELLHKIRMQAGHGTPQKPPLGTIVTQADHEAPQQAPTAEAVVSAEPVKDQVKPIESLS